MKNLYDKAEAPFPVPAGRPERELFIYAGHVRNSFMFLISERSM